jgi:hypothetical protein
MNNKNNEPKILLLDIETSPLVTYTWGLFDQNIGLNQVKEHTYIISWSAKFLGEDKVYYMDNRKAKHFSNDKKLVEGLVDLINKSDCIVGHNLKRFDIKKINYRCIVNNIKRPKPVDQIDTLLIARRNFAFDSNKLEHLAKILKVKNKKMTKREFSGFDLWAECMAGNKKAWNEMKRYNIQDTITLEDVFNILQPWAKEANFMHLTNKIECSCGNSNLQKKGFRVSLSGKYQRYICTNCGANYQGKENLKSKAYNKTLLKKI